VLIIGGGRPGVDRRKKLMTDINQRSTLSTFRRRYNNLLSCRFSNNEGNNSAA